MMSNESRVIWQHAAGDTDRNYVSVCLDWGVILNGPGDAGHWLKGGEEKLRNEKWCSSRKLTDLQRFAEKMKSGDLVVLRLGTFRVRGVGEIIGDYEWSDAFGDIDGWNLQHVRRVRWFWKWKSGNSDLCFPKYSMKRGDTTQRLACGPVFDWVQTLEVPTDKPALSELPVVSNSLFKISALSELSSNQSIASGFNGKLPRVIKELISINKWYNTFGSPSESETVTYLVVPLLRALGWTFESTAIEWKRVDLALFNTSSRNDDHLTAVVEVKKRGRSCLTAVSQAQSYAQSRLSCRRLIVTDGIRYGVFLRQGEDFPLHAYMNLTRLRDGYPVYNCGGVKEAVLAMTPEWTEA